MFYVYVLKMANSQIYIGSTPDLRSRITDHKLGRVFTTKKYLPVKLVYYECYSAKDDALIREKTLKQYGSGWSHLKKRLVKSLE